MPCLAASCAVVSSPSSASSATFALKSAEYRVRLPVIRVRPSHRRTELTRLSEIRGLPQVGLGQVARDLVLGQAGADGRGFQRAAGKGGVAAAPAGVHHLHAADTAAIQDHAGLEALHCPPLPATTRKLRCAVYTRKSRDEVLEKEFNTLDAQRDACEATSPASEPRAGYWCGTATTMAASRAARWSGRRCGACRAASRPSWSTSLWSTRSIASAAH